jgi:hypothetical protein
MRLGVTTPDMLPKVCSGQPSSAGLVPGVPSGSYSQQTGTPRYSFISSLQAHGAPVLPHWHTTIHEVLQCPNGNHSTRRISPKLKTLIPFIVRNPRTILPFLPSFEGSTPQHPGPSPVWLAFFLQSILRPPWISSKDLRVISISFESNAVIIQHFAPISCIRSYFLESLLLC